jgi:hypothetical protein
VIVNETVAHDLVDQPFVVIRHPKVVKVLAFTTREERVIVRLKRPKQRRVKYWVNPPSYKFGR